MKTIFIIRSKYFVLTIATVFSILLTTCDIFLISDASSSLKVNLEWIKETHRVLMDINPKYVFSSGEIVDGMSQKRAVNNIFTHEGKIISSTVSAGGNYGTLRAIVTDNEPHFGTTILRDIPTSPSNKFIYIESFHPPFASRDE